LPPGLIAMSLQKKIVLQQLNSEDIYFLSIIYSYLNKEKCITYGCDPINFSQDNLAAKKEGNRSIVGMSILFYIWGYTLLIAQTNRMFENNFKREFIIKWRVAKFEALLNKGNTIGNIIIFYHQSKDIQIYSASNPLMFSKALDRINKEKSHEPIPTLELSQIQLALSAPQTSKYMSIVEFGQ
jgi:hypothetical protein